MRRSLAAVAAVVLYTLSALPVAGAEWTRLHSPNFTIEGDVSERELRSVARRFEQFREVLGRLLPSARLVTPTPLTIVVFAHDRDFKPVRPLFQGKPVEASGYALVSPVGTSIAICLESGERAYPTIYHEFGHLLIANAVPALPLWAAEGLSEYYKTFELSADGRRAILGRPLSAYELGLMSNRYPIPMSQLLGATHDSALYNVSADRGRFYVQSWALVHYLQHGSPARSGEFFKFVNLVGAGAPADRAFTESITNAAKLEEELTQYVRQFAFQAVEFRFSEKVRSDQEHAAERMTPAEVESGLGHLLLRQGRFGEAAGRFSAALKLDPSAWSAHTGAGLVHLMQGRALPSIPSLREGVKHGEGDALAHYALGLAALRCRSSECEQQQVGDHLARKEFARTVELLPAFPEALSYLGYTELSTGGSLDDAERHLTEAITLLPRRTDYRLHLAQVHMARREYDKAQGVLGPIAAGASDEGAKAQAREMLGRLAEMKNAAARRPPAPPPGAAPVTDSPLAAGQPDGRAPTGGLSPGGSTRAIPLYREIKAGERRLEGRLESIDCTRVGIAVAVRDASGLHRFTAPSLDAIDFATYRDDVKGSVTCGPQPGQMPVYVTHRLPPAGAAALPAGVEGVVVAVEYLPKGK